MNDFTTVSSIPSVQEFSPLDWQYQVIEDVRENYDYSKGVHELLLSGSVGSAKTLLTAHIIITHCLFNSGAVAGVGRLTMPSLKETLFDVILKHCGNEVNIDHNKVRSQITFANNSKIMAMSWADQMYTKFRSYEYSAFAVEELTENRTDEFYQEMSMRVGRLQHVKEKFIINATNPDDPSHWAYKRFITSSNPLRHVYYSKTKDNPFLPDSYISKLENDLDPKMIRRMLYGEWLEIKQDVVYYAYSSEHQFRKDTEYKININYPIHITMDFNIAAGKPMSAVCFQFINDEFHFFNEAIIMGARTEDVWDEYANRGTLDYPVKYIVNGDATGKHRDTRSKHSDYDIIKKYLDNYKQKSGQYIKYELDVPLSNPKLRERHNLVNAYHQNAKGHRRVYIYKDAPTADEGFRLTKLREGVMYVEDDKPHYQHVTTACGYGIHRAIARSNEKPITMIKR